MSRTAIFAEILSSVSRETEVPESTIASPDRSAEAVDARYLLVYFLYKKGFYPSMIAPFINHQKRSVSRMLADFEHRLSVSPFMRMCFERLKSQGGGGNNCVIIMTISGFIFFLLAIRIGSFVSRLILTGTTKLLNKWTGLMSSIQTATAAADILP